MKTILPIMFTPLYENSKGHWNRWVRSISKSGTSRLTTHRTIHGMVYNAMKLFMEVDPQLFDDCSQQYADESNNSLERKQTRDARWEELAEIAKARQQTGTAVNGRRVSNPIDPRSHAPAAINAVDPMSQNLRNMQDLRLHDDPKVPRGARR